MRMRNTSLSIPPWFDCGGDKPHPTNRVPALGRLSIPPWFDCGDGGSSGISCRLRLSIPPWFDCGRPAPLWWRLVRPHGLSIPPWFDCGPKALETDATLRRAFNPTLVRLRRGRCPAPGGRCPPGFQSHLGSIAAHTSPSMPAPRRTLSIPPWFDCGLRQHGPTSQCPRLSIPPWFDCGAVHCVLGHGAPPLSIPPWFDCGQMPRIMFR